jgi:CBS domain-containing protein
VSGGTSLEEVLQRMRGADVRRVPVVDDRGRLIGILALDDIFEHLAQCVPFAPRPIRRESRLEQASHPTAMHP